MVAGASGFIAEAAIGLMLARGHQVVALSRDPARKRWPQGVEAVAWDAVSVPVLPGAVTVDAVVNLAGETVAQRWNPDVKARLRASRVGVADHLVDWVSAQAQSKRPRVFVTASGVGYYGLRPQGPQHEDQPPAGDFLARLCADWEDAAGHAELLGLRVVALRFGVVLHPAGGALRKMLLPFRLGVGGPLGSGDQPFAWVHRDDIAGALVWALETERAKGAYNVAAPEATDMRGFARTLAAALHRPALFKVPGAALRLLLGKGAADVVLGGQVAPPDRLVGDGFRFQHPKLEPALKSMLGSEMQAGSREPEILLAQPPH